ncbi:bifunctional riboflavin kinase/FAD synthetase [Streptococcus constellatus subsp. pharyngis]|uniref:Riboflavin biosynthesis protein n=1 Tax=Streptococcus constellatus subsp. pharyngis SK1060 = CCUG 46377 TaxID=1035184 RepID=F9P5I4_STRCV|nr:bifunctional riboflavin kinase/FAD synthetase [Streptococcus constellatus]AGU72552.1 bifunctional riboflavin kinase/FMN adenylyltransferase [Streptococcus constellatus subsp. pharyngis C232]AGU74308.1 bifunctional riboflavin kinase/FMN adenylyltransferase [Streptococcus constellatus subsp. pharyngis C818]AGU79676.1 bifunctional riboflavin kinase/FMN adenylyltransferase [Streptococcus constellatus subsp. pharyngis C1050]EGV10804.1 riboflavin biosynthesis protein RibF [Streptococcus constellat
MKTIRIKNEKDIQQIEHTVLVLGYFDGLHKGHQALFAEARKMAAEKHLKIAVLTFPESPKLAFVRYQPSLMLHLTSPEDRLQQMENLGVDYLYLIDFTSQFARNTAEQFFTKYISRLKAEAVIAGFDYHFGSDRRSAEDLEKLFEGQVIVVPSVNFNGAKISSTRIRETVLAGNVAESNQLLGYSLSTCGIVVHGNARGRTIGYPTANLAPLDRVILPSDGVYVVDIEHDGQIYRGMASVGKNVTFEGDELRFEANIFDFSQDIYGDTIRIFWLDKIRDMVKFDNVDELVKQLQVDKEIARYWSPKNENH